MPQAIGTIRKPRIFWRCARPGCDIEEYRVPWRARTNRFCSPRCARLVDQSIRYAHPPTDWTNFAERYRKQHDVGDVCNICGLREFENRDLRHHLDHNHETGEVRGLLCQGCNLHLGRWEALSELLFAYLADADNVLILGSIKTHSVKRHMREWAITRSSVCESCGELPKFKPLCADHCHETMTLRGVLCITCNVTLGWYEKRRPKIAEYLSAVWSGVFFGE